MLKIILISASPPEACFLPWLYFAALSLSVLEKQKRGKWLQCSLCTRIVAEASVGISSFELEFPRLTEQTITQESGEPFGVQRGRRSLLSVSGLFPLLVPMVALP